MISIYLDWNVFVQMKNNVHPDLKSILDSKRFLIPYSTSHISDILSGFVDTPEQRKLVNNDLDYLGWLTDNNCLSNDGKEIKMNCFNPRELFEDSLNEKGLLRNFSLETLEQMFDGDETIKAIVKYYIDLIKKIPLDSVFINALNDPASAAHMERMFPGLKDTPTMEGFFKSFGAMLTRMEESDDYKELRKLTQGGLRINRDQIFNSDDPYSLIEERYKNLSFIFGEEIKQHESSPAWFNEISSEYLKLDMHGYQEDKVITTKGRKQTFRNTMEDAFHTGFASTCNFYILNDNRAYYKTKKVFEKLGLNTLVFNPKQFVDYYRTFLAERAIEQEVRIPISYLTTVPLCEEKTEDGVIRTYNLPYFIFDFFNKMYATFDSSGKPTMIILSRFTPTNKKITYLIEIENLSSKLYRVLGEDLEHLGQIKKDEFGQGEWRGREWVLGGIAVRLLCPNGYFQLYFDFEELNGVFTEC
jgi:hypothetical protein